MPTIPLRLRLLVASTASWLAFDVAVLPASATAAPAIDLSWNDCAPIVSTRTPGPGENVSTLFVSVTGMDQQHRGYSFLLWFAAELACGSATFTPDAWRFDAAGCQDNRRADIVVAPPTKTCPALYGSEPPTSTLLEMIHSPDDGVTPPGAMRVLFAAAYNERIQTPDPGQRYFMAALRFNHLDSVEGKGTPGVRCGGYEHPVCLSLWPGAVPGEGCDGARYSDAFFVNLGGLYETIPIGLGQATFGLDAGTAFSCFAITPARATTWGAIKGQYR